MRTQISRLSVLKMMNSRNIKTGQNLLIVFGWSVSLKARPGTFLSSPSGAPHEFCPLQQLHVTSVVSRPHRKFPSLISVGQGARTRASSHGRAIAPMLRGIASLSLAFLFTLLAPGQVASASSAQPFLSRRSWKPHRELCRRCVCLWKWPSLEIWQAELSTWLSSIISLPLLPKCHFLNFPQLLKQLAQSHTHTQIIIQETEKVCHTCPF